MVEGFQVNALVRKSWTYQRKNVSSNLCILLSPIVIIALLAILQTILSGMQDSEECGCECLECILRDENSTEVASTDPDACTAAITGLSSFSLQSCSVRNESNCGQKFTSPGKLDSCTITQPASWPPVYDVLSSLDYDYSDDSGEDATSNPVTAFMHTGQTAFGEAAMQRFVRAPQLDLPSGDAAVAEVTEALSGPQMLGVEARNLLLKYGWDLGADSSNESDDEDAEPLDFGFGIPYTMAPDCAALNLTMEQQQQLADDLTYFDANNLLGTFIGQCVTTNIKKMQSDGEINDELYCTHGENTETVCGERRTYSVGAFDWKGSEASSLNVDVFSDNNNRISKPIDRVVGVFLEEWLGEGYRSRLLALSGMPWHATQSNFDISSFVGPLFFIWLVQLPLPWAVVQLVYEKQLCIRPMMRMHGLSNSAYLIVMYLYFAIQYLLYAIVMIVGATAAQLGFFTRNGYGVQIVFYFLFGNMQVAFAFLLSCFFTNTRTASISCWIWVLGAGLFSSFLLPNVFANGRWWADLVQLVPTFGAFRGLWELGSYAERAALGFPGMGFSDINRDGTGMGTVLLIFLIEWPVFMVLAWYLEQVISSATGMRKHWLFPFQRDSDASQADTMTENALFNREDFELEEDVLRERDRAYSATPGEENPIVLRDLYKEFTPQDGNPKKVAVANMSLCIARGECFGLLGPNGAGKSTSINMMTGFMEATKGDVLINGRNIKTDMNEIYTFTGMCPQHDLLWETLTAREHLNFYGRLKRLSGPALTDAVDSALKSVNLFDVADKRAGQFSGGMKRRLSCAISLIGDPVVTYLDEPSTGLDPASRRQLWGTISKAKEGKAMVLTTHSMEEAEVLCDRLGIFINGRMACVGPPKALAARYGGYHVFTITTPESQLDTAADFVMGMSPSAKRTYMVGGTSKWRLPSEEISLSSVFERVAAVREQGLQVLDWAVHSASLEEVFIQLAQEAGKDKHSEVVHLS